MRSWCKLVNQGNLGQVSDVPYFVLDNKGEEMLVGIVITMQMPQTPSASKSQTKIIIDVGGFHLAPDMTIVLAIFALHLFRMANWKTDG
jgi:hypothetical protein